MFNIINDILIAINNAGWSEILYHASLYIIIASVFVWSYWFSRKTGTKTSTAIILGVSTYAAMYLWMMFYSWVSNGFRPGGAMNNIYMFLAAPIFLVLMAKVLKIKWRDACYFIAPFMVLQQAIAMGECTFGGCCRGYPCSWGLYSIKYDYYYIPIQQINSLLNYLIFAFLIIRAKKNNYKADPYQYPLMLIIVGSVRVVCEFFHDNNKDIFGLSDHARHAILMVIVGVIATIIIKKKEKKECGEIKSATQG